MKNKLLTLSIFFAVGLSAQPVLTSSQTPPLNQVFTYGNDSYFGFPDIDEIADFNIDYSEEMYEPEYYVTYLSPDATPDFIPVAGVSFVKQIVGAFGPFSDTSYTAFQVTPTGLYSLANYVGFLGLTVYDEPIMEYPFPLTYLDTFTSVSRYVNELEIEDEIYDSVRYVTQTNKYTEVSGYGSLILPSGAFEVLLLANWVQTTDSVFYKNDDWEFQFESDGFSESYEFIETTNGMPVYTARLEDNSKKPSTIIDVLLDEPLKNKNLELVSTLVFFPNPSEGVFGFSHPKAVRIELFDITGRCVDSRTTSGNGFEWVGNESLTAGYYVVKCTEIESGKLIQSQNLVVAK